MKNAVIIFFILIFCQKTFAQTPDSIATSIKFDAPKLPCIIAKTGKTVPFSTIFKKNKASVLFFFSPTCDHCQDESKGIANSMDKLKNIEFYFIANHALNEINEFATTYQLADKKNVHFLHDIGNGIFRKMAIKAYPSLLVVSSKNNLVGNFQSMLLSPNDILATATKK